MDEQFVDEVSRRIPAMSRILEGLRKDRTDLVTASQLAPIIEQVEALHDASEAVEAGMMTMFLQGLRAFLMVAAYRKTTTVAQRLAAVESRIQALIPCRAGSPRGNLACRLTPTSLVAYRKR
jgi:hypothetical protein